MSFKELKELKSAKLTPIVDVGEFREYIKKSFGSGTFSIRKSIERQTYILDYYISGKLKGAAELPSFKEKKKVYVVLHTSNFFGEKEAFDMLFKDIQGKMIGRATLPIHVGWESLD